MIRLVLTSLLLFAAANSQANCSRRLHIELVTFHYKGVFYTDEVLCSFKVDDFRFQPNGDVASKKSYNILKRVPIENNTLSPTERFNNVELRLVTVHQDSRAPIDNFTIAMNPGRKVVGGKNSEDNGKFGGITQLDYLQTNMDCVADDAKLEPTKFLIKQGELVEGTAFNYYTAQLLIKMNENVNSGKVNKLVKGTKVYTDDERKILCDKYECTAFDLTK